MRKLEQQLAALERANEIRIGRKNLKQALAAGELHLTDVIARPPECAQGFEVWKVLAAAPRMSPLKSRRILELEHVHEGALLGNLTPRKRVEILARIKHEYPAMWRRWANQQPTLTGNRG